jgi:hypothetical protein
VKRRSLEYISNQDSRRFTERLVARRFASPHIIIIERGKIIMHERRRVQSFKSDTCGERSGRNVPHAGSFKV